LSENNIRDTIKVYYYQVPTSLGEPLSPERDDTSLKTKALRLSESSSRNLG